LAKTSEVEAYSAMTSDREACFRKTFDDGVAQKEGFALEVRCCHQTHGCMNDVESYQSHDGWTKG
jgi:hypothetical protein